MPDVVPPTGCGLFPHVRPGVLTSCVGAGGRPSRRRLSRDANTMKGQAFRSFRAVLHRSLGDLDLVDHHAQGCTHAVPPPLTLVGASAELA